MPGISKNFIVIPPPLNRLQMLLLRLLFGGYFAYLTVLLLAPEPYRWVGSSTSILYFLNLLYPFAHSISFAFLTVLALPAFRPLSRPAISVSLSGYAAITELLQKFLPPRTAEWQDWFQDLGGIAVGVLLTWMLATGWKAMRNVKEEACPEIAS